MRPQTTAANWLGDSLLAGRQILPGIGSGRRLDVLFFNCNGNLSWTPTGETLLPCYSQEGG